MGTQLFIFIFTSIASVKLNKDVTLFSLASFKTFFRHKNISGVKYVYSYIG